MLELFGRGYVIEHCISALSRKQKENAFKNYVCEALRIITKNTATHEGATYIDGRFSDVIDTSKPKKQDERKCGEIVSGIWARIRGD